MMKKMKKIVTICISILLLATMWGITIHADTIEQTPVLTQAECSKKLTRQDFKEQIKQAIEQINQDMNQKPDYTDIGISKLDEPDMASLNAEWLKTGNYVKWFNRLNDKKNIDTWALNLQFEEGADGDDDDDMLINPQDTYDTYRPVITYYDENDQEKQGTAIIESILSVTYEGRDIDVLADKLDAAYETAYMNALVAYETFIMDHPEVFWLSYEYFIASTEVEAWVTDDGVYSVSTHICFVTQLRDENNQVVFDIRHNKYNEELIRKEITERDQMLKTIIEPVKNKTAAEQVLYFNEYLNEHNELNEHIDSEEDSLKLFTDHPESFQCLSALRGTTGEYAPTSSGYVRAFHALCNYAGVPCTTEIGYVKNGDYKVNHDYNIVQIDGKWYVVDTVLNDMGYGFRILLLGKNTRTNVDGELVKISDLYQTSNVFLSGIAYTNGPALADDCYNHAIDEVSLSATETNYMYGYMEAPSITANVTLGNGINDVNTYKWHLIDPNGHIIDFISNESSTYTLTKELNVPGTYEVYLEVHNNNSMKTASIQVEVTIFQDVNESHWFYNAVDWAIENGITYGLNSSTFGSTAPCTRAQIVTFIWRAAGSPEPVNTTNTFKDVQEDAYYYNAVLWAVENGITSGYSAEQFAPDNSCTRAEMVTFLWRVGGKEVVEDKVHPYQDVKADGFYYDAMLWAVEEGIAAGYTDTKFAPHMTVTRAETVTFLYRANGHPLPTDKEEGPSKMLENKTAADDKGILYQLPNAYVESGLMQEVLIYENHLLVWGNGANEEGQPAVFIAILNMTTGEPLQKKAFTGIELANVEVCGEQIALTDGATGNVLLLDGGLQVLKEIKGSGQYGSIFVNEDATKTISFDADGGIIIKNISNGETKVLLKDVTSLFPGERTGNTVAFTYTDTVTQISHVAVIDLNTEEILSAPFEDAHSNIQYSNELWVGSDANDTSRYYIGTEDGVYSVNPQDEQMSLLSLIASPERLIIEKYNKGSFVGLNLYASDGTFLSEFTPNKDDLSYYGKPVWFDKDGGYYLILISPEGKDMLMFWDTQASVEGEDLVFEVLSEETWIGTEVSEELYVKANTLSDTYGIRVKIAEFCMEDSTSYTVEKIFDENKIAQGLEILENVLSSYPEGFFEQLKYADQRVIEIHLSGALANYDETNQSYTTVGGFANSVGTKNNMVVDISAGTQAVTKTFYHEIMHLIDYRMMFDAKIREEAVYSEDVWVSLNPDGFKYVEEYDKLPDGYYNDGYGKWFIDNYARTNSKEDRARVMEYAMIGDTNAFPAGSGRLNKLEYLCECIRDTFDTTDWPEVTVWEQTLADCTK